MWFPLSNEAWVVGGEVKSWDRNCTKYPRRAPHPYTVLYIYLLLLAVRICKGEEHAYNYFTNEREHEVLTRC